MSAADRARSPRTSPAASRRARCSGSTAMRHRWPWPRAGATGLTNVRFARGDIFALDVVPGSYDVVHAHQVLQHLVDPIAALVELRLVCRPGGVVAARDGDYASMTCTPTSSAARPVAGPVPAGGARPRRRTGRGAATAGVGTRAGFEDMRASASHGALRHRRRVPGGRNLWADRVTQSRSPSRPWARVTPAARGTRGDRSRIPALGRQPDALVRDAPRRVGALHRAREGRASDRGIPTTVTAPVLDEPDRNAVRRPCARRADRHAQGRGRRGRGVRGRTSLLAAALAEVHDDDGRMATEALGPRRPAGERGVRLQRCPTSRIIRAPADRRPAPRRRPERAAVIARVEHSPDIGTLCLPLAAADPGDRTARVGLTDGGGRSARRRAGRRQPGPGRTARP